MADLEAGRQVEYGKHRQRNGVYFFVIEGELEIDGHELGRRDGMGVVERRDHRVRAISDGQILAIEVPMSLGA